MISLVHNSNNKMQEENTPQEQPNNPLHGVKLATVVETLVDHYGWEELGKRININCFTSNPSVNSSLKFLRKTQWARDKVEHLYLKNLKRFDANSGIIKDVKPKVEKKKVSKPKPPTKNNTKYTYDK